MCNAGGSGATIRKKIRPRLLARARGRTFLFIDRRTRPEYPCLPPGRSLPFRSEENFLAPFHHDVTHLLKEWSAGDQEALDRLIPLVYEELRRQAAHYLRRERPGHTLQTTDLINEAYLRLVEAQDVPWQS